MSRLLLAAVLCAVPTVGLAQSIHDDPKRRRVILPYIRSATDCIAREALSEPGIVYANREMRLLPALVGPVKRCSSEVDRMVEVHDRLYYSGSGTEFFKGPYLLDLPRAVKSRIGSELERRYGEEEARRAAERAASDRQRADDERRAAESRALAEKADAERKLQAERLESDRRAEELRRSEIKRQQLENANRATDVLKDRMYQCAAREIGGLVRSGEGADVLASAAMTICSSEVDQALSSLIEAKRIESGTVIGLSETEAVKTAGRAAIRERVMAEAVKAKAARASGSTY